MRSQTRRRILEETFGKTSTVVSRRHPEWVAVWALNPELTVDKQSTAIVQFFSGLSQAAL